MKKIISGKLNIDKKFLKLLILKALNDEQQEIINRNNAQKEVLFKYELSEIKSLIKDECGNSEFVSKVG